MKKDALEVLALTLDHAGEQGIRGKTFLQKRLYFTGVFMERELGHRPHFYGPYSPLIESNLGLLKEFGLIEQKVVPLGVGAGGIVERHDLVITEEGKQFADEIRQSNRALAEQVRLAIEKIEHAGEIDSATLAVAAKVHFIVNNRAGRDIPCTFERIQQAASELGWVVDPQTAEKAAEFLQELGLVKVK